MLERIRPRYNRLTLSLGKASLKLGLSPNFWTLLGLFMAVLGSLMIASGNLWFGLVLIIAMIAADTLDGATARAGNRTSPFGAVLDHVTDRYAEFFLVGGFMVGQWISPALGIFTASGIIMASYVRAKAESMGGIKNCTVGITGRGEKLAIMILAIVLFAAGSRLAAQWMIVLIGVLSHITAIWRLLYTRSVLIRSRQP